MTISGGRTKQLDIFCLVTGFTSDFLSFRVVELIRFFHGAIRVLTDRPSVFVFCMCTASPSVVLYSLCLSFCRVGE